MAAVTEVSPTPATANSPPFPLYYCTQYINLEIASIHSLASVLSIQMFNSPLHVAEILPNISASDFLFVAAFLWFPFSVLTVRPQIVPISFKLVDLSP